MADRIETGIFGDALFDVLRGYNGEMRSDISLAKIARTAGMDYAYLHSLVKGKRGEREIRPSVEMVIKIIEALQSLDITINPWEEASLMQASAGLPETFRVVPVKDLYVRTEETSDEEEFLIAGFNASPPHLQDVSLRLIRPYVPRIDLATLPADAATEAREWGRRRPQHRSRLIESISREEVMSDIRLAAGYGIITESDVDEIQTVIKENARHSNVATSAQSVMNAPRIVLDDADPFADDLDDPFADE